VSLLFWNNPEFVRHRRAELRTTRAVTVAAIVLVICVLIWLGCWVSRAGEMAALHRQAEQFGQPSAARLAEMHRENMAKVWTLFFGAMLFAQLAILTFWSLLCCAQSISGERERKTWDFQRATRLSPQELLVGKLLGEPVLAYFIVLCCLPITVLAALLGHTAWHHVVSGYLLIVLSAIFIGLAGLWVSSLFESRSRGVGLIATFALYLLCGFAGKVSESSHFPGFAGFSPLTGLAAMLDTEAQAQGYAATIFGSPVSWVEMSTLLYVAFGGWFVLMLLRILKKDFDQIRPLSRWQSVGCAAFLNFTFYALFGVGSDYAMSAHKLATLMVSINGIILFAMGLATITSYERLKVWWRNRSHKRWSLFAEDSPPWPWLVLSGTVGYLLLVWGLIAWKSVLGFNRDTLAAGLVQFLAVSIYVTRDVLFIQWCRLTHMRAPVLKGLLYVSLYYIAAMILSGVFGVHSETTRSTVLALLTPAGVLESDVVGYHYPAAVFAGMAIQLAVIFLLLIAIAAKARHSAALSAATSSAD
jgi:ABC-type transport system involved in multi-copper enzyme maturation permease subunit